VRLTNTLPATVNFVSASPGYSLTGSTLVFTNLGDLGSAGQLTATIVVQPTVAGTLTNTASVGSITTDPLKLNNSATIKTVVEGLTLSAARSGSNITLSWPAAASSYVLESAASLSIPVTWAPVTNPPVLVGDQNTVTFGT